MTFYETLQAEFRGEVERLASFLHVPLSDAKFRALAKRASFDDMKEKGAVTTRKGVVGDHFGHLTAAHWSEMDSIFKRRLGDIVRLKPLHPFMVDIGRREAVAKL